MLTILILLLITFPAFSNNVMPLFLIYGVPIFLFGHIFIIIIEYFYFNHYFKPEKKSNLLKIIILLNIATTIIGSLIISLLSLLGSFDIQIFNYLSGWAWEGMNWKLHYIAVSFDFITLYFITVYIEYRLFLKTKISKTIINKKIRKYFFIGNSISYIFLMILYILPILLGG
jgi:hypothetical protein